MNKIEEPKKEGVIKSSDGIEIIFQDEMRYGLISNYKRSWSKKGKRTELKNQMEYSNRYLYTGINPLNGYSFHLLGFNDSNGLNTKIFLEKMKEEIFKKHKKTKHILCVWDNAPFHRLKALHNIPGISILNLPPYSPQLNPPERFFGELRKVTANKIYENIDIQEKEIEKKLIDYLNNPEKVKKLCGYEWIKKQVS